MELCGVLGVQEYTPFTFGNNTYQVKSGKLHKLNKETGFYGCDEVTALELGEIVSHKELIQTA